MYRDYSRGNRFVAIKTLNDAIDLAHSEGLTIDGIDTEDQPYSEGQYDIVLVTSREETAEERDTRVALADQRAEEAELRDRSHYERLKKRFEGK